MKNRIGNDWDTILADEFKKDYFRKLSEILSEEYKQKNIYPKEDEIFKAFSLSSYKDTKVVILGQDPYYNPDQAEGLAFSVKDGQKLPPSLRNIYKELENDLDIKAPKSGSLIKWAKQGVLLLNTVLTVEEKKPNSHKNLGWQIFTDKVIELLDEKSKPCVFILWGNNAKEKEYLINNPIHYIIKSSHPSPLSARRGFFGSKPFSNTNDFLKKSNLQEIKWNLED